MTDNINKQGILNTNFLYIGVALGFFNTVLRARVLSSQEIGLIAIITSISVLVAFPISFGMPSSILKFYNNFEKGSPKKTGFIFFSFFPIILFFILVALIFLYFHESVLVLYNNALLEYYIRFIYFFFFFNAINANFDAIFRSEHLTVKSNLIVNVVDKILYSFFLTAMCFFEISFFSFFIFNISVIGFKTLLFFVFLKRNFNIVKPDFSFLRLKFLKDFGSYSTFMFLSGVAGVMTATADKLMLGHFVDLSVVGIYAIVMTFQILLRNIGNGFSMLVIPLVAEHMATQNLAEVERIYRENANMQLFLGLFLFILYIVFGKSILSFLGTTYIAGYTVLLFLSLGELINMATGPCGSIITFSKYYRFELLLRFILMILAVGTNLVLIPTWGLSGAGIATGLSLAAYNLIKLLYVRYKFNLFPYERGTILNLLFAFLFGVGLFSIHSVIQIEHIALVLVFSVLYFVLYIIVARNVLKMKPAILLFDTMLSLLKTNR